MKQILAILFLGAGWHMGQAQSTAAVPVSPGDLTGTWVAIINEDWRYRMLVPAKGDFAGVPLNEAGRKVAGQWDAAAASSSASSSGDKCAAYGAAALLRMPTRLRISQESENILKLETDAGLQTRRLLFNKTPPSGPRTLQGHSVAEWQRGGVLKVVTNHLSGGLLRRNGVAYSENAVVTEYFDRFRSASNTDWFVVTTIVDDPAYLSQPFITSTQFRKEANAEHWRPEACDAR